jgi:DNA polymerase-3 subunit gamma/tau
MARKWRPKRFADVVGQEHVATTLLNSLRSGRTAHAYLFVGPRGIGKTSTARIFAKALNCPAAKDGEPCGECDTCREIADGRSMDIIEIDGASNNSVDDIRMLRENVKIAPATLQYKVYIIDEVHMLSAAAFNAFLKTLEEPPAHIKFIMATTEAHKIPMTVLSRCQRFDFRRLTSRQIAGKLQDIIDAEGIQADQGVVFAIARAAEGSMRDAQSVLDQLVSFSDGKITRAEVHSMVGSVGQDVYHALAVAIADGDSFAILKTIDDVVERGKDLAQFLRELTLHFRNLLAASLGGGKDVIDLPDEDLAKLKEISAKFDPPDLIKLVRDLTEFESRFRQLPSARVGLEMLLMRMAKVGTEVSIDNLLAKLTALEKRLSGSSGGGPGPSAPASPKPSAPTKKQSSRNPAPSAEPVSDDDPPTPDDPPEVTEENGASPTAPPKDEGEPQLDLWRQVLDEVREHSMSIYSFLNVGRFCGVQDGKAIVCFDPQNNYNKLHLEKKDIRKLIEETLKSIAGAPLKLKLIVEPQGAHQPAPPPEPIFQEDKQAKAREAEKQRIDEALDDPIVRKALDLFKGRIVYVSG